MGPAYAEATPEGIEAIKLLARTEGVFLEPVYTAKAFAALLGDVRSGALTEQDAVAFMHTGGTPLIFAYARGAQRRLGRSGIVGRVGANRVRRA